MHRALKGLLVSLGLVCGGCAGSPGGVYMGATGPGLFDQSEPGWGRGRPGVVCDSFGRCWSSRLAEGFDRDRHGHKHQWDSARPPSWAEALPDDLRSRHRFVRPGSKLVCDRASSICYKRGNVDKSSTQDIFGERAGDRADDLRDRLGTARLFVPQRDVACDRNRRVCFDDGVPDRKLSHVSFGREAAQTGEKTRRSRAQKS